ncbi:metal ABC transporter permease, partial [bacterium]|nr:metal ABC transporter permease [bacterium]
MSSAQIEIQLIASVVAAACAIPGVFLILRRMALMSDAISHAILLGIVVAFFIVKDLASPILMVAAALTGILTVALVEVISKTKLVKEDAALGLVFPVLFSIGVILISRYAGNVHLDADSVLLGELAFAPFNRLEISGIDIGPKSLYVMGGILVINIVFITVFFKELKLATFDAGLATILGFMPVTLHYALMGLISLTAVGAFDAVGSILVVALMIAPPATAYLLTDSLARMLIYSGLLAIVSAIGGYWLAHGLDASIAGSMATMTGIVFLLVFLFTPSRGLIAIARRRHEQKFEFAMTSLLIHLAQHEKEPDAAWECNEAHLEAHFRWESEFADRIIRKAEKEGFITKIEDL